MLQRQAAALAAKRKPETTGDTRDGIAAAMRREDDAVYQSLRSICGVAKRFTRICLPLAHFAARFRERGKTSELPRSGALPHASDQARIGIVSRSFRKELSIASRLVRPKRPGHCPAIAPRLLRLRFQIGSGTLVHQTDAERVLSAETLSGQRIARTCRTPMRRTVAG